MFESLLLTGTLEQRLRWTIVIFSTKLNLQEQLPQQKLKVKTTQETEGEG